MLFDPLLDVFNKGKHAFRENRIFIRCRVCLILCNVCLLYIRFLSTFAIRNRESALTDMFVCVCLRAIGVLYMNLTFPLLNVMCTNKPSIVHFCFMFVTGHLVYGTYRYKQLNLIYFFPDKEA